MSSIILKVSELDVIDVLRAFFNNKFNCTLVFDFHCHCFTFFFLFSNCNWEIINKKRQITNINLQTQSKSFKSEV